MKRALLLLPLLALAALTGCSDPTELGDRAIIQAAAIDFDGDYHVSAMLFSSSGSGGDTIDASQENVIRVDGDGKTLAEAIDNISLADGKRIYMSETKLLILGGGFEEENATNALKTLYYDMRCSLNMPVCCAEKDTTAKEISDLQFTEGLTSAEKPLALIENGERMGIYPKTTLLDLLSDSEGGRASLLPALCVTENGSGMTAADDGKTALLSGSRYFEKGILQDSLNEEQTAAYMLTSGRSKKIVLNYRSGDSEKTCEAYCIKIVNDISRNVSIKRVSAKFRTRNGGRLSETDRKAALNALVEIVGKE